MDDDGLEKTGIVARENIDGDVLKNTFHGPFLPPGKYGGKSMGDDGLEKTGIVARENIDGDVLKNMFRGPFPPPGKHGGKSTDVDDLEKFQYEMSEKLGLQ